MTVQVRQVYAIRRIGKEDAHSFWVEWTDGLKQSFKLSTLQRNCPCANCVDEATGVRRLDPNSIPDKIRAKGLKSVGRYALRVDFLTGCSLGIYSFDQLRQLGELEDGRK